MTKIVSPLVSYFLETGFARDYTLPVGDMAKTIVTRLDNVAGSVRINFKSDPELDAAKITAIEVVTTSSLVAQAQFRDPFSGDFLPNITNAISAKLALGIARGEHIIAKINMQSMVRSLNSGKYCQIGSEDHVWQDCFIEIEDPSGIVAGQCVMTIIYFEQKR